MNPAELSVRRPVLVNLLAIAMVVMGAMALSEMTRESIPDVPTGWCQVQTLFPGASTSDVEELITGPLETAIAETAGIDVMWSVSQEGLSSVYLQFDTETLDVDRAVLDVANRVANVVGLPEGSRRPIVRALEIPLPTLAVAVRGEPGDPRVRAFGLELAERLEGIEGVANVQKNGIRRPRLLVEADMDRLTSHRLPLSAIHRGLAARGANVPAGEAEGSHGGALIRGMAQIDGVESAARVVVRPDPTGAPVRVADVARVQEDLAPAAISGRVNGQPAVVLIVQKSPGTDSIEISEAVRALTSSMHLPEGLALEVFGDTSVEVRRSLDTLYENAAAGFMLVIAVLWLFLGARNATMAALGIPVALAGALWVMNALGISLNAISLLALILCLGIVVDDAIILVENIHRHMEMGSSPHRAAIDGTREVFWPVVSSTLTTWAAFLPLLMVEGVIGELFAVIPKVVVAALAASLIEAMFILPSHMADFGRAPGAERERPETRLERLHSRLRPHLGAGVDAYERLLGFCLRRRYLVVGAAIVCCSALTWHVFTTRSVVLLTDGDVDAFDVRVRMPADSRTGETEAILEEMEARILSLESPEVDSTVAARGMTRSNMGIETGAHLGMITVHLRAREERASADAGRVLLARVAGLFDDVVGPSSIEIIEERQGPPRGAPVAIRLLGEDLDTLLDVAEEIEGHLVGVEGVIGARHSYQVGRRELQVHVDEDLASLHGLTPPMVVGFLRDAFSSDALATTRIGGEEVDVVVRLADRVRDDPILLGELRLMAPDGAEVRLADVANIEVARGPGRIRHRDGERIITVFGRVDSRLATSESVNSALIPRLSELRRAHPEVEIEAGGQFEQANSSLRSLASAFGLAALLVYVILAAQFQSFIQPLIVLFAVPLSFFGVAVGQLAHGGSIGFIALVGVVGLAGIVVNDSLVLVGFINQRRAAGMSSNEAITRAGRLRLRPILLTSITTVASLLPLALAGEASPLLAPMANAIAWGLSFATVLTLLLVPCLYGVVEDLRSTLGFGLAADLRGADPTLTTELSG